MHGDLCKHLGIDSSTDLPDGEKRADYFALFVFLVSRDYYVALPRDATGLSAGYDCGIS